MARLTMTKRKNDNENDIEDDLTLGDEMRCLIFHQFIHLITEA